ncbi:hypothetical protein [Streptomyces sp. NPDC056492]|uniref:hypothetical protein n=1 Tax=unclassified Streptomyces TaxID=2593676 RepID=UPI0036C37D57
MSSSVGARKWAALTYGLSRIHTVTPPTIAFGTTIQNCAPPPRSTEGIGLPGGGR